MDSKQALLRVWEALYKLPDAESGNPEWDALCEAMDALAVQCGYPDGTLQLLNDQ